MKRNLIPLIVAILATYGCGESKNDIGEECGDGILGKHEVCEGSLFMSGLKAFCPNGRPADEKLIRCTSNCTLDLSSACDASNLIRCGDGIVEGDEACDGSTPPVVAGCDNPDLSKLSCRNCQLVDEGVCPEEELEEDVCGNGKIDEGELCDGDNVPAAARVCPENMVMLPKPLFKCSSSCQIVDVSKACTFGLGPSCGNKRLDEGEACDGADLSPEHVDAIDCGPGKTLDKTRLTCTDSCQIDTSKACVDVPYEGVLVSELVPYVDDGKLKGVAVEFANRGDKAIDLSSCSLALFSESKLEKSYSFASLNLPQIDAQQVHVVCSSKDNVDQWGGACNYIFANNEIINNLADKTLMGIVCGKGGDDTKYVDFVNINSFLSAIAQGGATDFIRKCQAHPHTRPQDAKMSDGWTITAYATDAPRYDLGTHCSGEDVDDDIACKFSISTNQLTSRKETVDMALEIKVRGITDVSDKTDISSKISVEFYSGEISDDGKVERKVNHYVKPAGDMEWTNDKGYDRYIGTLRNFDTYEGFWSDEQGRYTVDACVSFDNGATCTYCGPKGIVKDYETYIPSERATLTVAYEPGTCGNGVIDDDEICDGDDNILPEAIYCDNPNEVILNPNKVTCGSCRMISTIMACGKVLPSCDGKQLDEGEVCDGDNIPDEAKVCPVGETVVDDQKWICGDTCAYIDASKACEVACGNGKIDAKVSGMNAEICDGDIVPDDAKVCPSNMIPKENPVWNCNSTCSGIDPTQACEMACGNGRLDPVVLGKKNGEVCDGDLFVDDIATQCKEGTTYEPSRKLCNASCNLDSSSCIPDRHIVVDEYAVVSKPDSSAKAFAFTINLYGDKSVDASDCTLSFLDEKRKVIYTKYISGLENGYRLARYAFLEIGGNRIPTEGEDSGKLILKPCDPLVVCSIPSNEADYEYFQKTALKDKCDASLTLPSSPTALNGDFIIKRMDDIAHIQLTCGGEFIDFVDFKGLSTSYKAGNVHGKLKSSDLLPWSSYETVVHTDRFDVDKTFDITTFATPVCSNSD